MPTFINEAVLSLPEQVEKNKNDIEDILEEIGGLTPSAIEQIEINKQDITAIKQEQIVQNTAINNNTLKTRNINIDGTQYSKVEIIANVNSDMDIIASGLTIESTDVLDILTPNANINVNNSGVVKISNDNNTNKVVYDGANGNFTINGDHVLQYNSGTGSLTIDGDNVPMKMEDIKDANGNLRFIEGSGVINPIQDVTILYNKWSLSGTHLMIVLALDIANNAVISAGQDLCSIFLPNFIINKLVNLFGDAFVDLKNFVCRLGYSDSNVQNILIGLRNTDGRLYVRNLSTFTATDNRKVRIQFDILIDND